MARTEAPTLRQLTTHLQNELEARNVVKLHQVIMKLKRRCASKHAVMELFMDDMNCYHWLLTAMDLLMGGEWDLQDNALGTVMFKELLSLIANLCHFTITAATELRKLNATIFPSNSLRLLESGLGFQNDTIIKAALLRLLGNLADYKETASLVTCCSSLLDKVAFMINDSDKLIYDAAIRVVRQLSKHRNYTKFVMMANCGYFMGVRINDKVLEVVNDTTLLGAMELMSKTGYAKDFGRQVSQSNCTDALLKLLYCQEAEDQELLKRWKLLIVHLTKVSFPLREMFNKKVIEQVVENGQIDCYLCNFLICFAEDAYGRSTLRTSGGLILILERMAATKSLNEQAEIVTSFRNFIHDAPGLSMICHRSQLLDLCLNLMGQVLKEKKIEHRADNEPEDQLEAAVRGELDSRLFSYEPPVKRAFILSNYRNSSYSPPQTYSPSISPRYPTSPLSAGSSSLSPLSSPPYCSREHSPSPAGSYFGYGSGAEDLLPKEQDKRITIINDCIWLYRFISHDDTQIVCLVQPKILSGFISYLAKYPSINDKLAHTLKGVARARLQITSLLEMRFPYMLIFELIKRPCMTKRFVQTCSDCAEKARSGFEILNDFVGEVDSPFGLGVLNSQINSLEKENHLYGLLNGLLLIKSPSRRNRFCERSKPLEGIFEYIKDVLENCSEAELEQNQLIKDMMAVLGFLIARRYLHKIVRKVEGTHDHRVDCQFQEAEADEPQVNLDEYDEKEFLIFIHYLTGCRDSECVQISDAKTCVSLLYMADKYLCTELSEEILRANGVARRKIDGDNLLFFLPVILSSWLYRDRFGDIVSLVFLKFSTTEQQVDSMKALVGNAVCVQLFVELLQSFVLKVAESTKSCVSWDF
ncbi:unnamed protein product [Bursaphelenchus okinawaensis]|uniref:Uncharacterized protein n=1 Tax=Bursaphelenchus okinawaensis TaxID=465554 RepID=A0A811JX65_9BILA|nr:unnamed protein product [Bursaphelenchus okinawaensis]CAG9086712.1 unnamed protein product [Bursaphelenchus okinawaensis]